MNLVWISRLAQMATPVAVAAIIILSWLPGNERPHTGASGQVEHAMAYTLTATGIAVGFPRRTLAILLTLIGLAAALEIGQLWVPGRTSRLIDFCASSVGAMLGLTLTHFVCSRWIASRLHRSS